MGYLVSHLKSCICKSLPGFLALSLSLSGLNVFLNERRTERRGVCKAFFVQGQSQNLSWQKSGKGEKVVILVLTSFTFCPL